MSDDKQIRDAFAKKHPIGDEVPGALREAFFSLFQDGWSQALATREAPPERDDYDTSNEAQTAYFGTIPPEPPADALRTGDASWLRECHAPALEASNLPSTATLIRAIADRIDRALASQSEQAPPVEPTDEQIQEIFDSVSNDDPDVHLRFARALLAATPPAPAAQSEQQRAVILRAAYDYADACLGDKKEGPESLAALKRLQALVAGADHE